MELFIKNHKECVMTMGASLWMKPYNTHGRFIAAQAPHENATSPDASPVEYTWYT